MKLARKKHLLGFLTISIIFLAFIFVANIFFKNIFSNNIYLDPALIQELEIEDSFSAKLYFNNEFNSDIFSSLLIKEIKAAQKTIEIAVYSMDNALMREALYEANDRGVEIFLIFSDTREIAHDQIFENLPKSITRLDIPSDRGYMHHKFLIIDRGYDNEKLFFGSSNFTYLQEKYDPSFIMETSRPEIIKVFGEEFDRLALNIHSINKLNTAKEPLVVRLKYPEGFLEIWFAPQIKSGLKERMLGLIRNSKNDIKAIIWNFTNQSVAVELASAAKTKNIRIITDDSNYLTRDSVFPYLLAKKSRYNLNNLEIITDVNRNEEVRKLSQNPELNSFIHHHLLLVDGQTVLFGTNNWTNRGFYSNDESVIISDIPYLFKSFDNTWEINYKYNK